jgi:ABC-type oligopeptide transport system substrate-binding subunit
VQFENLEFSEYLPLLDAGEMTGVFRLGWGADNLTPLNFRDPLFASKSIPPEYANTTITQNADFDAALAEGKAAIAASGSLDDAIPSYQAAEDILCNEVVPVIPIYFTVNQFAWNDTVDNVVQSAVSELNYSTMTGGDVVTAAGEPEHLTPPNSNESEGNQVLSALFSQLIEYDPVTSEPTLVVADSITTEDGGTTYTITLKDGWTFHDGTPVTAESFVKAWNYAAKGANAQSNNGFFNNIVGYTEMNPPTEEEEG